jgi:hypothetical protein
VLETPPSERVAEAVGKLVDDEAPTIALIAADPRDASDSAGDAIPDPSFWGLCSKRVPAGREMALAALE